jgi:hypothetical protein
MHSPRGGPGAPFARRALRSLSVAGSRLVLAVAVATGLFAQGPAWSQPANPPVGELLDAMQAEALARCTRARETPVPSDPIEDAQRIADEAFSCRCVPQALDAAFPAAMRATAIDPGEFEAGALAVLHVCAMRNARELLDAACARGIDPLVAGDEVSSPPVAAARCACLRSEVSKDADRSFVQVAGDAAASYRAIRASPGDDAVASATYAIRATMDAMRDACLGAR